MPLLFLSHGHTRAEMAFLQRQAAAASTKTRRWFVSRAPPAQQTGSMGARWGGVDQYESAPAPLSGADRYRIVRS